MIGSVPVPNSSIRISERLSAWRRSSSIQQVRTVGAQVVVDRLLVSDVDENTAEDSHLGVLRGRNQQAALHHVLQKAHSFEAHRLAARIRPRDNENVLLRGEYQIERNDTFALFAQGLRQQGVSCVFQQDRAPSSTIGIVQSLSSAKRALARIRSIVVR